MNKFNIFDFLNVPPGRPCRTLILEVIITESIDQNWRHDHVTIQICHEVTILINMGHNNSRKLIV